MSSKESVTPTKGSDKEITRSGGGEEAARKKQHEENTVTRGPMAWFLAPQWSVLVYCLYWSNYVQHWGPQQRFL